MSTSRPSDDELGRMVRDEWLAWARQQPDPKPSWLIPWDSLDAGQREVDIAIGRALFNHGARNVDVMTTRTGQPPGRATATALAARAFMKSVDSPVYLRIIETRAVNGGWAGARTAGLRDTRQSDAVSKAAVDYVLDLFRTWAAECDRVAP